MFSTIITILPSPTLLVSMLSCSSGAGGCELSDVRVLDRVALGFLTAMVSEVCYASTIFGAGFRARLDFLGAGWVVGCCCHAGRLGRSTAPPGDTSS